jgi:hypothetical protein
MIPRIKFPRHVLLSNLEIASLGTLPFLRTQKSIMLRTSFSTRKESGTAGIWGLEDEWSKWFLWDALYEPYFGKEKSI